MKKRLDIILYKRILEELNDDLAMNETFLEEYQRINDEENIKIHEKIVAEYKELINEYNNKLNELQGGDK